ncbi:MAG: response regulator transcription factor [Candidatus Sumerlaeia bacterium]
MPEKKILIVEDEPDIARAIQYNLTQHGYRTHTAGDGLSALEAARSFQPHLIVLDIMLPELDGFEVCRRLKADERTASIPILILTVRSDEADVVKGLELGAEDYVVKPFRPRELTARIKAILRREEKPNPPVPEIHYYQLTIIRDKREALMDGVPLALSRTEFEIVALLASSPGRVFSRQAILEQCWPQGVFVIDRSVDVHINSIRRKLGPLGRHVETVRGIGYKMRE